jgi:DNA polymerase III alpha subunit
MGDLTLAYPHLLSRKEERKRKKSKQNPKEIEQIKEIWKKAMDFPRHFSVHDMPSSLICHLSSLLA